MNSLTLTQFISENQEMELLAKSYAIGRLNLKNKTTRTFSNEVTEEFSKYNPEHNKWELFVEDLPDFIQYEFASMIIAEDDIYANEANSVENPFFKKNMLPALLKHLKDITNKDLEIDFINTWKKGVAKYLYRVIDKYIVDSLSDLNQLRLSS